MVVKRSVQSVAVYARRSRKKETLGIDVQLSRCRAVAAEEGWRIADEYVDDDRSAYGSAVRESYDQMMADLAAGRFDAVLVYKADRLGRDDRERRRFEDAYTSAGLWLVATSSGGRYDLRTADGVKEFREAIIGAEHYSRQLSERMRDHHRMLAETGQDSGGMRPFGFEPDRVTVRASEAAVIRDAAQRVLRGESLRSIAARLNTDGSTTSEGAVWRSTRLRRMLTAPRYGGLRVVDDGMVPAVWPAILDRETFETVGALLHDPHRRTVESTARKHVLSGFVWCGSCGKRLYSHGGADRRVYRCHSGPNFDGCGKVSITAAPLDEYVFLAAYPHVRHLIEVVDQGKHEPANTEELADIDERLREAGRMFAAGEIDAVAFAEASKGLRARRSALVVDTPARAVRRRLPELATAAKTWSDLYGRAPWEGGSDLDSYRSVLTMALDRVVVHPSKKRGRRFDKSRVSIVWR